MSNLPFEGSITWQIGVNLQINANIYHY